ncbi:hypothetical protein GCM10010912_58740 [Paenibacillus albidus]|uniref:Uncharacterized protein n=1 Tax=Paenibacillus albidus TaxID=2041023 RepID=A0A917FVD8_9BACL|nr:hypothetical protein [Paenibacillus albidus]GGG06383.1 hypothetical protein GCM10010912_58740 [Paenibacillus albidus]
MHIILVGVRPEISDPHFKFHVCGTPEEVKESSLILMPEYVLIHEDQARGILLLAEEIQVKFIVISQATSLSSTAVRSWTALGASDVWMNQNWQEKLLKDHNLVEAMIQQIAIPDMEFSRVGERVVIAVGSVFGGAGSTHTALLIAHYLSRYTKTKVALWEGGSRPCYSFLEYIKEGNFSNHPRYDLGDVSLYKAEVSEQWIRTLMNDYRYTVLDLGNLQSTKQADLFVQASLPVLVGSGSEWRINELISFCREHSRVPQEYWRIALPLANEQNREIVAGCLSGRPVFAVPNHPDPFGSQADTNELLEGLLFPVLQKQKKRGFSRFF